MLKSILLSELRLFVACTWLIWTRLIIDDQFDGRTEKFISLIPSESNLVNALLLIDQKTIGACCSKDWFVSQVRTRI